MNDTESIKKYFDEIIDRSGSFESMGLDPEEFKEQVKNRLMSDIQDVASLKFGESK